MGNPPYFIAQENCLVGATSTVCGSVSGETVISLPATPSTGTPHAKDSSIPRYHMLSFTMHTAYCKGRAHSAICNRTLRVVVKVRVKNVRFGRTATPNNAL